MADQFLNKTGLTRLWTKVKSYMGATYFKLTGGTLTGNVVIQPTGTPNLSLSAPEKENVGRSKTTLYKNASSTVDYGTMLIDYVWGNGSSENQRTTLRLLSSANSVADRIALLDYAAGGSYTLYRLYGEHNKPSTSDITGLATALAGKAPSTHSHGAGDITSGTLNTARLPTVPISKGGTGAADALAAITALGGLSAASIGTPLTTGDDIDALLTPGTYLSADSTVSASLQGTPPYTTGGFKLYVIRGYQNGVTIQLAQGASVTVYCRIKTSSTGTWGSWQTYALGGHSHGSIRSDGSIGQDTDPEASDRLLIADASDGMAVKRGNIRLDGTTTNKALTPKGTWETFLQTHQDISGKADVGHTHSASDITEGTLNAARLPSATASTKGAVTLGASGGAATYSHTHSYLPLSGGTLTGRVVIDPADSTSPGLYLIGAEKENVGASRTALYKSANASTDYGTYLSDYVWGDASSSNARLTLAITRNTDTLRDSIRMIRYLSDGTYTTYYFYGTHNLPGIANITGLQTALDGKAAASHTHAAGDITGTLSSDRLPTVPITKGGTGATSTIAALTALGGLSAKDYGTLLASGDNLNTLLTPGTYYCNVGTVAANITCAPVSDAGFRLFVAVGHNTNTIVQTANTNNHIYIRSTPDQGTTWTDWAEFSKVGHVHNASSITAGTLDAARLPTATSTTQGAVILGASGGAAAYSHTHSYLPLAGGTLTGNLVMDPTGASAPILTLVTADGTAGPGRLTLYKNANATADYGTQLTDYAWGDGGSTSNKNVRIILRAATSALDAMLTMSVNLGTGGSSTAYRLYGEHYRPMVDPQDILTGTEDLNTITDFGWYRCRTNTAARSIKHTPGFDATTLVNTGLSAFNLTVGRIASDYAYQEVLVFNTGKRWYRYTANPTAASPSWGAWNEH